MSQIRNALAHYWHLRDEGMPVEAATAHVRQRFGVVIDQSKLPAAEEVAYDQLSEDIFDAREVPIRGESISLRYGQDFCKTVVGCYDGGRRS